RAWARRAGGAKRRALRRQAQLGESNARWPTSRFHAGYRASLASAFRGDLRDDLPEVRLRTARHVDAIDAINDFDEFVRVNHVEIGKQALVAQRVLLRLQAAHSPHHLFEHVRTRVHPIGGGGFHLWVLCWVGPGPVLGLATS